MFRAILALSTTLALAACNTGAIDTDAERGLAGAAIGAGTSAVLDGSVAGGAVAGAAAGVFCDDVGACR
ncbi:hypothetical protein [Jannaschia seohaensis]|uniref:YMGG-like Gly-zipper n=1 Tax=Jannaschia seohaensis TaxID=475081 RepID=A0A2Y9AUV2_9RHOB|nr:hypothetical protein [Jannaschia seohaensis]PWJ16922.1 hypothetical protein BCF38_10734 [Jannaschia seohaensis]SSA48130.1 hypothetical protein SAMN05421539_10734 [Jannaschia seohaensis]